MYTKCGRASICALPSMFTREDIIFDFIIPRFRIPPVVPLRKRLFFRQWKQFLRGCLVVSERTRCDGIEFPICPVLFHACDDLRSKFFVLFLRVLLVENTVLMLLETGASEQVTRRIAK